MISITEEQRRAINDAGGQPVRVEDPLTSATYILVRVEAYERLQAMLGGEMTPEEMAPLMWDVMKEDWDDPAMDAYDRYPEQSR